MQIPPQKLVLTALIDGRAKAIERVDVQNVLTCLEQVKGELGDSFEGTAQAHQSGQWVSKPLLQGLALGGLTVAAAVGVATGLGALGLPLLAQLGGGAGALALGNKPLRRGLQKVGEFFHHKAAWRAPAWSGKKTFEVGSSQKTTAVKAAPDAKQLVATLGESMGRNPGARSALLISGHGLGYYGVAGLPTHELGKALDDLPKPVDLAVFDSCLMGNLESLAQLGPNVNLAVAAETIVPTVRAETGALPLAEMLKQAARAESPEQAAVQMVETAHQHLVARKPPEGQMVKDVRADLQEEADPSIRQLHLSILSLLGDVTPTLAAFDLARLRGELLPALDRLGTALSPQLTQPGKLAAIGRAALSSRLDDTDKFCDLGDFLSRLHKAGVSREEVEAAQAALQGCLLHKRGDSHTVTSGLSVQVLPMGKPPDTPQAEGDRITFHSDLRGLPPGWVDFVHGLKSALLS